VQVKDFLTAGDKRHHLGSTFHSADYCQYYICGTQVHDLAGCTERTRRRDGVMKTRDDDIHDSPFR